MEGCAERYNNVCPNSAIGSFHFSVRRLIEKSPHVSPGHTSTHEEGFFSEGNVDGVAPTSAMICWAESTLRPGTSVSRFAASWYWLSRLATLGVTETIGRRHSMLISYRFLMI